jgi:hypothetical protein
MKFIPALRAKSVPGGERMVAETLPVCSALHITSLVPSDNIFTSLSASKPRCRRANRAIFSYASPGR